MGELQDWLWEMVSGQGSEVNLGSSEGVLTTLT